MPIVIPTVTTQEATGVGILTATLPGTIVDAGGENCTDRGFELSTTETVDKTLSETGSHAAGIFSNALTGYELSPSTQYYFRAYATNSAGTGYGVWRNFTTFASQYAVTIDGVDRTGDIVNASIIINDIINDQQNTCQLSLIDLSETGAPATDTEIIITGIDGTIKFGGYITTVQLMEKMTNGIIRYDVTCVDYARLFDRNLVHKTYQSQTDKQIIEDIVAVYCKGSGITTVNVVEGVTIDQIQFNYIQPSQCLRKIADLTGRNWYIDYDKDIHYWPLTQSAAPYNIDSSADDYSNLFISRDASQLKNRVYVRGGTKLSDETTYTEKGDGTKRKFVLPDKPHDVTVLVNGVEKTVGVKNVETSGYDWYLNYQEKYLDQDSGGTVLSTSDTLTVTYSYDIPILVAVENTASILANGVQEFAIFDKSISTTEAARDRASAELTDYANTIIEGGFDTHTDGFISGQYIHIDLTNYGVDDDYLIQSVTAKSIGAGQFIYSIKLASAKTMGIIRFLIELLEANKNLIELDDNEVIDELVSQTDALLSDSILDSLVIDSAGPYSTWCTDSLDEAPNTRARWDLFQWG